MFTPSEIKILKTTDLKVSSYGHGFSYVGIIKIRLYGSKVIPSSQPWLGKLPVYLIVNKKQETTLFGASCKKSLYMTSYGGIIRIRL